MDVSNTPELLRQHGAFVRHLARALLADPAQAEDVAQEALTRWVTQPPRDASRPRAWLTTVVRRLAANARREEARRAQHEEQAAAPAGVPSALEASEQAELVQRVVAAVMELEPAQRDTLLSRYFRGLSVRELAAESSTSADTVRTRERRALEKLRAKLDRGFGGRASWALGLGKLAERSLVPTPTPAAASGAATAWVGVAGVLALASTAAVFWFSTPEERSARGDSAPASSAPGELQVEVQAGAPEATPAPVVTRTPVSSSNAQGTGNADSGSSSAGSSGDSSSAFTSADLAEIRGTFLLEGGAPAAHVPLMVGGWEADEERLIAHGLPEEWVNPQGESEADGTFSLSFAPPRAFQFVLEAKAAGHVRASWYWNEIEAGSVLDLGTVTLLRGATVTGRLVDAAGAPLLGQEWTISVDSLGLGQGEGHDHISVQAEFDPASAEFRAEDVMPGGNELRAHHRSASSIRGPRVIAVAGSTVTADIVYAGPDVTKRITVLPSCQPFYVFDAPSHEHIRLLAPDGSTRTATKIAGSAQSHSFDDLAPGAYAVTIDDPRFRPWSQSGVLPGTAVSVRLEPCSTVALHVVDAAGQPLALDALTVELGNGNGFPREILAHDGSAPFDGSVHLVPGDYTLHARAGELEGEVDVLALGFDETRAVTLSLGTGARLSGRVLDASGAALGGVQMLLLRPAQENDSRASPILPPQASTGDPELYRNQLDALESEADGSFAFRIPRGGAYLVYAELPNGLCTDSPILSLADDESRAGLELAFAPGAAVSGAVRAPGGASCAGLRLWIGPVLEGHAAFRQHLALDERARTLPADGRFAFDGLPAGTIQAVLLLPESAHPTLAGTGGFWNRIEIARFELAAGQALVRDLEAILPGTFTLEVRLNGAPAVGSGFAIEYPFSAPNRPSLHAALDGRGMYGPALLFPGPWSVRVNEAPGIPPAPLDVQAGGQAHTLVDVLVCSGSLHFLDAAGAALVGRSVSVFLQAGGSPAISCSRRTTDGQGNASFTLAPGAYFLRLDESEHPSPLLEPGESSVPLTWTSQGPQTSEIRF